MSVDRTKARKRAENEVWTAAGQYGFLPGFLAFHRDGSPDAYLNAIVGFSYRFYDRGMLDDWLDSLQTSAFAETFTDVAWMGIEAAVYPPGLDAAPGLASLRREHARRFLADARSVDVSMQERMMETGVVETLKKARCREALGEKTGLRNPWDIGLYRALQLSPQSSTEALIAAMEDVLHRYFRFRFDLGVRKAFHIVLPEAVHALLRRVLPIHRVQDDAPRRQGGRGADRGVLGGSGVDGFLPRKGTPTWRQACEAAGAPYFPEDVRARIEEDVCRGGHAGMHVYFAKRGREEGTGNIDWARAHAGALRMARRRLQAELANTLEVVRQPLHVAAKRGRFDAARAWRAVALGDARVFEAVEQEHRAAFDVMLLLDASASRESQQAQIAAEAEMMAAVLGALSIPVQVWSYASADGVTVLTALKPPGDAQTDGVYGYHARGWNRDGLALRAAGALLAGRGKHVVLMLTDAHPGDDMGLVREGVPLEKAYMGDAAVEDAAQAAAELRQRGIRLVGLVESVFPGEETDGAAHRIFGDHFVRVRNVASLAKKAGRVIAEELAK